MGRISLAARRMSTDGAASAAWRRSRSGADSLAAVDSSRTADRDSAFLIWSRQLGTSFSSGELRKCRRNRAHPKTDCGVGAAAQKISAAPERRADLHADACDVTASAWPGRAACRSPPYPCAVPVSFGPAFGRHVGVLLLHRRSRCSGAVRALAAAPSTAACEVPSVSRFAGLSVDTPPPNRAPCAIARP